MCYSHQFEVEIKENVLFSGMNKVLMHFAQPILVLIWGGQNLTSYFSTMK